MIKEREEVDKPYIEMRICKLQRLWVGHENNIPLANTSLVSASLHKYPSIAASLSPSLCSSPFHWFLLSTDDSHRISNCRLNLMWVSFSLFFFSSFICLVSLKTLFSCWLFTTPSSCQIFTLLFPFFILQLSC